MRVLVIHAHPVPESYNSVLLNEFVAGIESVGMHDLTVADLNAGDDPDVDDLLAVEALAFVYPTWWGGFPAILLDWVQRRLGPWIDGAETGPSPVRHIRRLVAVTTHGSDKKVNGVVQGEPGRQLFTRGVGGLCRDDVGIEWVALYSIDKLDDAGRSDFIDRVAEAGRSL